MTLVFGLHEGSRLPESTTKGLGIFAKHLCVSAYCFGLNLGSTNLHFARWRISFFRRLPGSIFRTYQLLNVDLPSTGDDECLPTGRQSRK